MIAQPGFRPEDLAVRVNLSPQCLGAIKRSASLRQYLAPALIRYVV